jgi:hypothetical protein
VSLLLPLDSKGFINTPSAVANGDGDMRITNSCDGRNGSDFVTPDNFKINVVGGKRSKSTYSLVLKVSREINNVIGVATKTIAINIIDPK